MKLWPFRSAGHEVRNFSSAQDELIHQIAAGDSQASFEQTALYQGIAAIFGRAFSSAEVEGADMSPDLLGDVGRLLLTRGEAIVDLGDGVDWRVPSSWQVTGGDSPSEWMYRLHFSGPSKQRELTRPATGLLHFTYESLPYQRYRGTSPLQKSRITAEAFALLERQLKTECAASHGTIMTLPVQQSELPEARKALNRERGKLAVFASSQRIDAHNLNPQRYGLDTPSGNLMLYQYLQRALLSAVGIPPSLFGAQDTTGGTESRENWRQFLSSTIRPIGNRMEAEFSRKLGRPVTLSWKTLMQSDIAARARAAGTLTSVLELPPSESLDKVGL